MLRTRMISDSYGNGFITDCRTGPCKRFRHHEEHRCCLVGDDGRTQLSDFQIHQNAGRRCEELLGREINVSAKGGAKMSRGFGNEKVQNGVGAGNLFQDVINTMDEDIVYLLVASNHPCFDSSKQASFVAVNEVRDFINSVETLFKKASPKLIIICTALPRWIDTYVENAQRKREFNRVLRNARAPGKEKPQSPKFADPRIRIFNSDNIVPLDEAHKFDFYCEREVKCFQRERERERECEREYEREHERVPVHYNAPTMLDLVRSMNDMADNLIKHKCKIKLSAKPKYMLTQ